MYLFYGHPKGPPGSECWTLTWLVSPAIGCEKKWNPLILDKIRHLELNYTLYNVPARLYIHKSLNDH